MSESSYIIEYVAIGNSVKTTAIDPITMREASIIGATSTPKKQLAKLAVRKLVYMLEKDNKSAVSKEKDEH